MPPPAITTTQTESEAADGLLDGASHAAVHDKTPKPAGAAAPTTIAATGLSGTNIISTIVLLTITSTLVSVLLQSMIAEWLSLTPGATQSLAASAVDPTLPYTPDQPVEDTQAFRDAFVCRDSYRVSILSRDPQIFLVEDFLQPGEAEYLRAAAKPLMNPSLVAGDNNTHQARTSSTAFLGRDPADPVTQCVEMRASRITQIPIEQCESLQVVWYTVGQEYKPHHDYLPRERLEGYWAEHGGQRFVTMLAYMNEDMKGGGTRFPKLGLEIAPKKNMALWWYNVRLDEVEDHRTLHAGLPVEEGEKFAINIWQRKKIPGWDSKVSVEGTDSHW